MTLYYLYIDESGDAGDYLTTSGHINSNSSKFFTLGGIIVNENTKNNFETNTTQLIQHHFSGVSLEDNFKLHYHPLRQKTFPYDQLTDENRWSIPESIFRWISESDCSLLAVTIDLEKHCKKYERPANPVAYTLLVMLERFQYFLEENNDIGIAIYEKYNAKMRKKSEIELKWLSRIPGFNLFSTLDNIEQHVMNGNPQSDPILQMSDFFTYLPWLFYTTNGHARNRLDTLRERLYNLNGGWNLSGFVLL